MNDDHDLRLVASFRGDIDEPSPQRVASMRAEFLKGRNVSRKSFFTRKRIGLIGGPVIAAIAVGAFALAGPGNPTAAPTPDSSVSQQVASDLPADADARTVMAYFAVKAANGETTALTPGQFILEHSTGPDFAGGDVRERRDWLDPSDFMNLKKRVITNADGTAVPSDIGGGGDADAASLLSPNLDYLNALPTDADALVAAWRAEVLAGTTGAPLTPEDVDRLVFKQLTAHLLSLTEVASTPTQRGLIWEAASKLAGITRTPGTVTDYAGRAGIAIGIDYSPGNRLEIIIDPTTSETLGDRSFENGVVGKLTTIETKVVNSLDEQ